MDMDMETDIYQTLNKLKGKQQTERKQAKYIYLDETDNKIKEIPLSKLDSAGASLEKANAVKIIHYFIFHR